MTSNCNRFALLDDEAEDDVIDEIEMISEVAIIVTAKKKNKKKKKAKQERIGSDLTFQWLRRTSRRLVP